MPKRKSGGQSAQAPKQAAGGASRSSNPQAANRASTSHRDYRTLPSSPVILTSSQPRKLGILLQSLQNRQVNFQLKCPTSRMRDWLHLGTGAASSPRPPQNAQRPPNGTRCKPLASKSVSNLYPPPQPIVLLTGLMPEVSVKKLELVFMNFVGLHWSTLLVQARPQIPMNTFDILLIIRISITSRSNVRTQGNPRSERGCG